MQFKYLNEILGISLEDFWESVNKQRPRLWETLPEYSWFPRLYTNLSKLGEVVFCTTPTIDPRSVSGKLIWLQHRFGRHFRGYVMTEKKYLLAKEDTLLVDDDQDNVNKFLAHGGNAILVPQPWNGGCAEVYNEDKIDQVLNDASNLCASRPFQRLVPQQ